MTKTTVHANARQPWVRPAVEKMVAGKAEVGTRNTQDGDFATS